MRSTTFHLPSLPNGERWTARAGQELVGRHVRYGRLGKVGEVASAVVVGSGRAVRLHVALSRSLVNPDPARFTLAPPGKP